MTLATFLESILTAELELSKETALQVLENLPFEDWQELAKDMADCWIAKRDKDEWDKYKAEEAAFYRENEMGEHGDYSYMPIITGTGWV